MGVNMKIFSTFALAAPLLLTASLAAATPPEALCRANPGRVVEAAKGAPVLVMRSAGTTDLFRLEATPDTLNTGAKVFRGARRVRVEMGEIQKVCAAGYDVGVIDIPPPSRGGELQKGYVEPVTSLPSSFTIVGLWNQVWGNFWVPQTLPAGHTYQVVDFQVTPYQYANSGPFSHLTVSVLTTSNSNFQSDFDGKGVAIGGGWTGCSEQSVGIEAWAIQNWSESNGCVPGPTCQAIVYAPDSCLSWDNAQPRRFLVGANIWQSTVYWSCPATGPCPGIVSPAVDTYMSGFRSGGAGVAFVHVLGNTGTLWSLSFNGVQAYTGP